MTEDNTNGRRCTASDESRRPPGSLTTDLSMQVLGAYDAVKGTDAFILAVTDRDDAWLAVAEGGERTLEEWR